jgi:hypothetical protein
MQKKRRGGVCIIPVFGFYWIELCWIAGVVALYTYDWRRVINKTGIGGGYGVSRIAFAVGILPGWEMFIRA